jgi:UDPglucose 6-dehydrogenase
MVRRNSAEKRLEFTKDLPRSVRTASIVFIAVGTPQHEDGSADLTHVLAVAKEIAKAMNGYKVIVDKSTVPVGTAARVREVVRRETTHPFSVVSNPEFLKQGAAVEDFLKPDRVVIGVEDERARELMLELYAPFTRTGAPIMMMDCASAELSKYAANAILATRISFMNEVANVCEAVGADVDFLFPGIGFGGSCFPKDIKALIKFSGDKGYDFQTLKAVERVNEAQKVRFISKLEAHFGSLKGKTVALWGLSFKPRTDDMRDAPAITIIERLLTLGASVRAYDPEAGDTARKIFGNRITLCEKSYDTLADADALAIITEWNEFREPDFKKMRHLLKSPVVFDGRNIYAPEQMHALGFTYFSIGR